MKGFSDKHFVRRCEYKEKIFIGRSDYAAALIGSFAVSICKSEIGSKQDSRIIADVN